MDTSYAYWKELSKERGLYKAEKEKVSSIVIDELNKFIPGIKDQVEIMDVATPLTFERYTGNWQGMQAWPVGPSLVESAAGGFTRTLPGLENFYMAGQWADASVGLAAAAASGRRLIQMLCEKDGKQFVTMAP